MANKIQLRAQPNKIYAKSAGTSHGCSSDQHPWFSFRYMTPNAAHSLKFLDSLSTNERERTLHGLISRIEEISSRPWLYWTANRKASGLETLSVQSLRFPLNRDVNLTKDATLYVFRFSTYQGVGKGRIIGFKSAPCAVYHVLGYDFNFTAYQH